MHPLSEPSAQLIHDAASVELLVFSPDGHPLATVPISRMEALRLVSLPVTLGHVFRAVRDKGGRGFMEVAGWDGVVDFAPKHSPGA